LNQVNNSSAESPSGTSIGYDLLYHSITTLYSYFVLTAIMVGGYIFLFQYASYGGPVADCDVTAVNPSKYQPIKDALGDLSSGTYAECITTMQSWFKIVDLNDDQYLDRCEDAKFLYGFGNTEEYALTYGGIGSVTDFEKICATAVPDAFEAIQAADAENDVLSQWLDMWPLNLLMGADHEDMSAE
jgi:hypothetical protein